MWSLEIWAAAITVISCIIFLLIHNGRRRRRNAKYGGLCLPPGSSGLPLVGESFELLIPSHSLDVHPFIKNRIQRYGPLFRTNVAGHDVIVSTDGELNHFLFQQEGKLVERSYLDLVNDVFKTEVFNAEDVHNYLRRATLTQFGFECIMERLLSPFEEFVRDTLHAWSLRDSVELVSASILEVFGEFGIKQVFGDIENSKELLQSLLSFSRFAFSFPLNIPGTTYHKCIKDKDKALKIIRDIVRARIASPQNNANDDLLSKIIARDMNKENFLSEDLLSQMLFGITFGASDTIAPPLAVAVKLISENPAVLQELIVEHEEILKKRESLNSSISFDEYKSMNFTLQVLNETLRLTNTVPGLLRKAIVDISANGYTIPAGWMIMVSHQAQHLDPKIYDNPLRFDPWRWKSVSPELMSKNLIPFGGGIHQCVGADFARASLCVFLHVLVTKYRWSIIEGDIVQNPMLHFKNGLHISIYPAKK